MFEAKELLLKTVEHRFTSSNYISELENVHKHFVEIGPIAIKENISLFRETTRVIFGIEIDDKEVIDHWTNILNLKSSMPNYDIRIIAFDYFINRKMLRNPKILEMDKFVNMLEVMFQDPKTYAYNYTMMKILINYEIEKAKRYGGYFSLLIMDLDNFKYYNDTHGHQFGDEILEQFSKIVLSCIRKSDLLFRYGGDEFVVFCPETKRIGARVVAEKIKQNVELFFSKRNLNITTSIGISVFPVDGDSFEEILDVADKMLYFSKSRGRNRITDIFDYVDENDRRRFPRIRLKTPSVVSLRIEDTIFDAEVIDISKSGILVRTNSPIDISDNTITLNKIKLGESEYLLDIPVKVIRNNNGLLGIDFNENKILETLIYLLDR